MVKKKKRVSHPKHAEEQGSAKEGKAYFVCPRCGRVPREEVVFLCNTCGSQEMVRQHGMLLCPQCLQPGENFQCFLCESKEVELREQKSPRKTKS